MISTHNLIRASYYHHHLLELLPNSSEQNQIQNLVKTFCLSSCGKVKTMLDQNVTAFKIASRLARPAKHPQIRHGQIRLPLLLTMAMAVNLLPILPAAAQNQPPNQSAPNQPVSSLSQPRFRCRLDSGRPTVMYYPDGRPRGFTWATPGAMGGGWSPERRCFEISRRLEEYRPDGLVEMRTGAENNQNIVCATTDRVPGCRIIFTVPPGQDPVVTRDRVFQNLLVADRGNSTEPVATFAPQDQGRGVRDWLNQGIMVLGGEPQPGGRSRGMNPFRDGGIYLKPFLSPADGGTGSSFNNSLNTPDPGRQFRPGF